MLSPSLGIGGSLTHALHAVTRAAGCAVSVDELHAALGLSWLICAVPEESNVGAWMAYGRDMFLVDGAALFGLRLRDLHPQQAAHGLHRADEFEQHFDASYRPLIHRALEHDQPVLAWRGWRGETTPTWGLIQRVTSEGVGFAGTAFVTNSLGDVATETPLDKPTVQVYVVEVIEPSQPSPERLLKQAVSCALRAIQSATDMPTGVLTGPRALRAWNDKCVAIASRQAASAATCGHSTWAVAVAASLESALRFVRQTIAHSPFTDMGGDMSAREGGQRALVALVDRTARLAASLGPLVQGDGFAGMEKPTEPRAGWHGYVADSLSQLEKTSAALADIGGLCA